MLENPNQLIDLKHVVCSSELYNYKEFPTWGRAVFNKETHPFFKLFEQKFDCSNFSYLNSPLIKSLPKNLYSTHPNGISADLILYINSNSCLKRDFFKTSEFFQEKIKKSFITHVLNANPEARYKNHSGFDLTRGSLGVFLLYFSSKCLIFEKQYSPEDKFFIKKYIFLLEINLIPDFGKKNVAYC